MAFSKTPLRFFPPLREINLPALAACLIIALLPKPSYTQTFNEWFRQKKTQIKYLTEQIAHLQAQIILLKKGYEIAKDRWEFISDVKDCEFTLHKDYFTGMDKVNSAIDDDPKRTIAEIKQQIQVSK